MLDAGLNEIKPKDKDPFWILVPGRVETELEEFFFGKTGVSVDIEFNIKQVTGPDGKVFNLYVDKESGLPVKLVNRVMGVQGREFTCPDGAKRQGELIAIDLRFAPDAGNAQLFDALEREARKRIAPSGYMRCRTMHGLVTAGYRD